jgi:3-methyladenine DNA glycosylase AlkD
MGAMAQTKREPDGYERLTAALRAFADAERAAQEKRYQKSSWEHWGVALPKMDAAIRATVADLGQGDSLALAARLWREPVWDLRIVAGRILARKSVVPDADVWAFVMRRMGDLDGWAVADNLAVVGGRCLLADPARLDFAESWVESPHLWTRRGALVFTLPWTKDGRDPARMLGWAARLAPEREWFIQKAIGWWLRELCKRDPARVRRFLDERGAPLMAVARREATKYLAAPPSRAAKRGPRT